MGWCELADCGNCGEEGHMSGYMCECIIVGRGMGYHEYEDAGGRGGDLAIWQSGNLDVYL